MKKIFLILVFLFLSINICPAEVVSHNNSDIYKTVVFKNGEADANKILYNFALEEMHKNNWPVDFKLENVIAYKVDLDDDGLNEIVGAIFSSGFAAGSTGHSLFILKKSGNKYKDLSSTAFWAWGDFKILNKKVNNFHTIKFKKTDSTYRYLEYSNKYYH